MEPLWLVGTGVLGLALGWALGRLARRPAAATPAALPAPLPANEAEYERLRIALDSANRDIEDLRRASAERIARKDDPDLVGTNLVLEAIQRSGVQTMTALASDMVDLPDASAKGRIIGREGRNIRTFERVTGVDLIIDEDEPRVTLSSFDPMRREIARLVLLQLLEEGKIQPARIEALHAEAAARVAQSMRDAAKEACRDAGVHGLPPAVMEAIGRLRFRYSVGQNVLDHSVETARIARHLASALRLDPEVAGRAAFLHDIGKAGLDGFEGTHALAGMAFLQAHGEAPTVCEAVGAHHGEIPSDHPIALLVVVADQLSSRRPGARRQAVEEIASRIEAMEAIAKAETGVEEAYAVQAGRELRVIVRASEVTDEDLAGLAERVARRIEGEVPGSGRVVVTVVRENRFQSVARPGVSS